MINRQHNFYFFIISLIVYYSLSNIIAQNTTPCYFDQYSSEKIAIETEQKIQAAIYKKSLTTYKTSSSDDIRTIPVVVHIIHDSGSENISQAQIESQIQILNEDYGKITGTNGDGNGVDTKVQFCLAKIDHNGNCTNGIVRIKSLLTNHQTYQRALLKELSFWDNDRYLNIYIVKSINGNVGGYSSFPGGPAEEDGVVVRHNLFGNIGTASSSLGRTTTHELGHWFGLYHTFNNGCGTDTCLDGDYVCDTPPQELPSYNCNTLNTCSNDLPDVNDQKENYMSYTPDACKNIFTNGQKLRIQATLDTFRTEIWSASNLITTGCDSTYITPSSCSVVADFVTLSTKVCNGNSIYFIDKSLNNPTNWQWTFQGGIPYTSNSQNPNVTYDLFGIYSVKLKVWDSTSSDSVEFTDYITVSLPGKGNALSFEENFDVGIYPPSTLTINNPDGGVTWELDSLASVSGKYSLKINNLINTNYGSSDELILPYFDFATAHPDSDVYMSFKWAYAKSDATFSDELLVLLSTDCGVNYTQIFYKTQNTLATAPTQATPFIPDPAQWKDAYISLNTYRNESYVQLKIVNVTDGGNNLYIDDIYTGDGSVATTGINEVRDYSESISLFPNPSNEYVILEYALKQNELVQVFIYSMQEQLIKSYNEGIKNKQTHRVTISTENLSQGLYFVKVKTDTFEEIRQFTIMNR